MAKPGFDQQTQAQVIDLYNQGLSDYKIGEIIGRSRNSVRNYRVRNHMPAHKPQVKPRPKREGVHWSKAITPEEWAIVREFFEALLRRKTYGRILGRKAQ